MYSGVIEGWAAQTIPVVPGPKRIMLRAEGYISQRFDIEVASGEEVTLVLRMEPVIEEIEPEE